MGFAVGNERIIAALARVKSYLDYGAFTPIQVAATAALNGPEACIREMRECWCAAATCWWIFGRAGWEIPAPRASMFAWAPIPEPFSSLGTPEFTKLLVEKAEAAVSPGIGFGEYGEGYVRIALVENEQRIRQGARNIRRFLESAPEKLHNVVPPRHAALTPPTRRVASDGCASQSRSCGFRHGRIGRGRADRARAQRTDGRAGRPIELIAYCSKDPPRDPTLDLSNVRKVADPVSLARDANIDVSLSS